MLHPNWRPNMKRKNNIITEQRIVRVYEIGLQNISEEIYKKQITYKNVYQNCWQLCCWIEWQSQTTFKDEKKSNYAKKIRPHTLAVWPGTA